MSDSILIIDFGSQVTQLIARRLREAGVYTEILACTAGVEKSARPNQMVSFYRVGQIRLRLLIHRGRRKLFLILAFRFLVFAMASRQCAPSLVVGLNREQAANLGERYLMFPRPVRCLRGFGRLAASIRSG